MKKYLMLLIFTAIAFYACSSEDPVKPNDKDNKKDTVGWTSYTSENSAFSGGSIDAIAVDNSNNIWIGADSSLFKFNGSEWTKNSSFNGGVIYAIDVDNSNNVWIGASSGLHKFDGFNWTTYTTANSELIDNHIRCLAVDNSNNVWIGTNSGLHKFDGSSNWSFAGGIDNPTIAGPTIAGLVIDDTGNIWVKTAKAGFFHGYSLRKFDGSNWSDYTIPQPQGDIKGSYEYSNISYHNSNTIAVDKNNNIWIPTGYGLQKFDGGTKWTAYTEYNSGLICSSLNPKLHIRFIKF